MRRLVLSALIAAVPTLCVAQEAPYVEGWAKRTEAVVRTDEGEAVTEQQWNGSIVARGSTIHGFRLFLRADSASQAGQVVFENADLWRGLETYLGVSYRGWRVGLVQIEPAVAVGRTFALEEHVDRERLITAPLLIFGGARFSAGQSYLYVGTGIHETINAQKLSVMSTLHVVLPVLRERTAVDLDIVTGRAGRLIVSYSVRVF